MMSDSSIPPREETATHQFAFVSGVEFRKIARLSWRDANGAVKNSLIERRVVVGSAPSVDLLLDAPTVSRIHAELELRDDTLWVRDLHSKNGTFVDGIRVESAAVPHRKVLTIGGVDITISYDSSPKLPNDEWPEARFHDLVGGSHKMRELYSMLARVAPTESAVMIQGETGTGKEVVARSIHRGSKRADKPFIVVDCGALPENLLDAELFGHAKGAFTGADRQREGAFEAAHGGTIFLDEIGELPLSMQPKLLRVLEARTVRRLGETQHRAVDVRILSATHRDLARMVNEGTFREDLFFRLSVLPVRVPPLRERPEDIPELIDNFLGQDAKSQVVGPAIISDLARRPWRGNVRELRNFVERARTLGAEQALNLLDGVSGPSNAPVAPPSTSSLSSQIVELAPLPPSMSSERLLAAAERFVGEPTTSEMNYAESYRVFREKWIERGEREYLRRLLERHGQNVSAAAREAEVDRTYLYKLIRKFR